MKDSVSKTQSPTPILFPFEPEEFWVQLREIIRQEVAVAKKVASKTVTYETPGMQYKPLYKMSEVCGLFQISKPTVYEWIRHGKLKPFKIRSRVFFLWNDVRQLLGE